MLALSANPTFDHQVFLTEVMPGTVSRSRRMVRLPGGKHVDVARAARGNGVTCALCTLVPRLSIDDYVDTLRAEGLTTDVVPGPGSARATIVLFEDSGRSTVINGLGAPLDPATWQSFVSSAALAAAGHAWACYCGSLPPGAPSDALGQLCDALHSVGAKVAIDAGGQWLDSALAAHADLVTPNLSEARRALGTPDEPESVEADELEWRTAPEAAAALVARGARAAAVSVGAHGVGYATAGERGLLPALTVPVVSPIGAGDALLGGTLVGLERGERLPEALANGIATAAAAIGQTIPGAASAQRIRELRDVQAATECSQTGDTVTPVKPPASPAHTGDPS